jgi:hypothetical protein
MHTHTHTQQQPRLINKTTNSVTFFCCDICDIAVAWAEGESRTERVSSDRAAEGAAETRDLRSSLALAALADGCEADAGVLLGAACHEWFEE